jgi:hypothetical protein
MNFIISAQYHPHEVSRWSYSPKGQGYYPKKISHIFGAIKEKFYLTFSKLLGKMG